jgi:hypothetical protein
VVDLPLILTIAMIELIVELMVEVVVVVVVRELYHITILLNCFPTAYLLLDN